MPHPTASEDRRWAGRARRVEGRRPGTPDRRPAPALRLVALLLGATLLGGAGAAPAALRTQAPAPPVPPTIEEILAHPSLEGARVGMLAVDLGNGETVLSRRADELFAPASVTKLFTTATALWRLGPHFVWRTPLAHGGVREGGTIRGDLWVLGRGAPDLVEEKLWLAAGEIRDAGVERVVGDLVVDDRYFDQERYAPGWPGGRQVAEAYHAPIGALMANYAARRGDDGWEAVQDPAVHLGRRLHELLAGAGVAVDGIVRRPLPEELRRIPAPEFSGEELGRASVPAPLQHLHTIESEPLGRLVMDVNKFSNNVMAEVILKALGAIEHGAPGTTTKGLTLVARFLDDVVGVPLNSYVQADGSGLSRLGRVSPTQVMRLLRYAYNDFHIGPELVASLKLGGLDGWNPAAFKRPPLVGELRVKSGHIRGVNTLTGFVHTDAGRVLAFCAMVNEHGVGQWEVDQRMAEIVAALKRAY